MTGRPAVIDQVVLFLVGALAALAAGAVLFGVFGLPLWFAVPASWLVAGRVGWHLERALRSVDARTRDDHEAGR